MDRALFSTGSYAEALSRNPSARNSLSEFVSFSVYLVSKDRTDGQITYKNTDGFFENSEYFEIGVGCSVEEYGHSM